jgi:hypothetical protein
LLELRYVLEDELAALMAEAEASRGDVRGVLLSKLLLIFPEVVSFQR